MDFKQKLEPKGNRIIHGAGQSLETFSNYWNAVENFKPIIYMTYVRINKIEEWSKKIKKEIKKFPNLILQIGLNFKVKDKGEMTKEIKQGEYDEEIVCLAKAIREIKNPVFIRIGYEFNEPKKYNSKDFISAWKYIVGRLKSENVKNFASVWCACTAFNKDIKEVMKYYPGDAYVDWFGNDLFAVKNFKDNKIKITEDFCKEAEKHKKPLMIGESSPARTGVLEGGKSWNEWFKPYFKWIKEHKVVKAFCYINWNWGVDWKTPDWGNGRIEENEEVRKRFIKELKNPRYIHNQKIKDFLEKIYS